MAGPQRHNPSILVNSHTESPPKQNESELKMVSILHRLSPHINWVTPVSRLAQKRIFEVFVTAATMILFSLPMRWESNEYMYFSQAVFSGLASEGFASSPQNPTNWFFIHTVRLLVDSFGLDEAWLFLRLLAVLSLSIALVNLSRSLGLPILTPPLSVLVFVVAGQTYMADEWILEGVESKVFAYACLLFAISIAVRNGGVQMTAWATAATILHPHVGVMAWILSIALSWRLQNPRRFPPLHILTGLASSISYLSVLVFLASGESNAEEQMEARRIYTSIRHPHHLVPFGEEGFFNPSQLVLPVVICALLLFTHKQTEAEKSGNRKLSKILLFGHAGIPLTLTLAYFDIYHLLGQLYIFRYQSALLLLSVLLIIGWLIPPASLVRVRMLVLLGGILLTAGTPNASWGEIGLIRDEPLKSGNEVIKELSQATDKEAQIFVDFFEIRPVTGLTDQNFELLTNRGLGANWKFVPTTTPDILKWFERVDLVRSPTAPTCTELKKEAFTHILTKRASSLEKQECGEVIDLNEDLILVVMPVESR